MSEVLLQREKLFIDATWRAPLKNGRIKVISPFTEEPIGSAPEAGPEDIDAAVAAARKAFDEGPWPLMSPQERAGYLRKMADYMRAHGAETSRLITQEMGAPIKAMAPAAGAPAALLEYYAEMAVELGVEEERGGVSGKFRVRREPVGVVGAIVPWNGPLFLLLLKCAPALAAGCAVVAKPAPETPLDAFVLADAAAAAGLPPGVLNILPGGRETGEHLVSHSGVDKISFTGSTAAGRRIAEICGRDLRRCGLELGGKSAAIVLEDADPSLVASIAVPKGLAYNNGQACVALTRIIVPRACQHEFVDAVRAKVEQLQVGDPLDETTDVGPLVAQRQQNRVENYIALGKEQGAKIAIGGDRPRHLKRGWFVAPTVFYDATNDMRISQEEIFGPVGTIIPYDGGDDEAVRMANDSIYGLGGAVFTGDEERGYKAAKRVRAGTIGVNTFEINFAAPFGGFKASGMGREMSREGLMAYYELKTVRGLVPKPNNNA